MYYPPMHLYPAFPGRPIPYYGGQTAYRPLPNEMELLNPYQTLQNSNQYGPYRATDYGDRPFVINIDEATRQNQTFRTALWTGNHMQVTLMSIAVGDDIGLENHPTTDQFLRIEEGEGIVVMGDHKDQLNFSRRVYDNFAIMIPAGKWHNLINTGNKPLKLYSIYAPPEHPYGTVHRTKAEAIAAETHHTHVWY